MKDYSLKINGHKYSVQINDLNEQSKMAKVVLNGVAYDVEIDGISTVQPTVKPQVARSTQNATNVTPSLVESTPVVKAHTGAGQAVRSPLPGTIVSVNVSVGAKVAAGDTLLILEAMKMENNIDADCAGTVKEISAKAGATVMEGEILVVIE
ncbi:MAG: biotin/lipoyl-containing protein [Rikenellaceae bacterium]